MAKKIESKPVVPVAPAEAVVPAKPKVTKPKAAAEPSAVTNEMIAERAYHKWKNGEPGDEHHHWVTAERELRGNG